MEILGTLTINNNNIFLLYMNNLPDPDLVVFKNVLHKNKTENDIINIVLKKLAS